MISCLSFLLILLRIVLQKQSIHRRSTALKYSPFMIHEYFIVHMGSTKIKELYWLLCKEEKKRKWIRAARNQHDSSLRQKPAVAKWHECDTLNWMALLSLLSRVIYKAAIISIFETPHLCWLFLFITFSLHLDHLLIFFFFFVSLRVESIVSAGLFVYILFSWKSNHSKWRTFLETNTIGYLFICLCLSHLGFKSVTENKKVLGQPLLRSLCVATSCVSCKVKLNIVASCIFFDKCDESLELWICITITLLLQETRTFFVDSLVLIRLQK